MRNDPTRTAAGDGTNDPAYERILYIAEHLFQMVDRETWREHGAEWMGVYEGDHHAESIRQELVAARAALTSPEARKEGT